MYTSIFTITAMTSDCFHGKHRGSDEQRTFGYEFLLGEAENLVINNYGDIHETNFMYVVIEEVFPGFCNSDNYKHFWYKWNIKTQKYKPIKNPKHWNSIVGISIG